MSIRMTKWQKTGVHNAWSRKVVAIHSLTNPYHRTDNPARLRECLDGDLMGSKHTLRGLLKVAFIRQKLLQNAQSDGD